MRSLKKKKSMFRTSHNDKTRMDMLSRTYCHTLNSDSMEGTGDPSSLFLETALLSQVKCYPPSDRGQAAGQGVAQSAQHPGQEGHHAFEASLLCNKILSPNKMKCTN